MSDFMPNSEDLRGLFGLGTRPAPKTSKTSKAEKGVPWEAKVIDGEFYVPLRQVATLLSDNGVLPKVSEGIKRRCTEGPS